MPRRDYYIEIYTAAAAEILRCTVAQNSRKKMFSMKNY
jgi:hypothetical protein